MQSKLTHCLRVCLQSHPYKPDIWSVMRTVVFLITLIPLTNVPANAQPTTTNWILAQNAGGYGVAAGNLGSTNVSVILPSLSSSPYGTFVTEWGPEHPRPEFDYAPIPLTTKSLRVGDNWTASFNPPIVNLGLYANWWTGKNLTQAYNTYTFDQPFIVAEGFEGATFSGNSMYVKNHTYAYASGILIFPGPISSLSVTNYGIRGHGFTFAAPIPLPNQPPTANGDNYTVIQDSPLTVAAPGLLGNDSDPDGDPLTAILTSSPSHGTLTLSSDGSFTYVPHVGFVGIDSFDYHNSDGTDQSLASVELTVNEAPGEPIPIANCGGYDVFKLGTGTFIAPGFAGDLIVGTDEREELLGSEEHDLILGLGGDDAIWGGKGDDVICGGPGADDLEGNQGGDSLFGEDGSDVLLGGEHGDELFGGPGKDYLYGQGDGDSLHGGDESDYCQGGPAYDTFTACEEVVAAAISESADGNSAADDSPLSSMDIERARAANDGERGEDSGNQFQEQLFLPLVSPQ